jgi:dipeptidyl aminopeptidase/acylaminoacyl peptidase
VLFRIAGADVRSGRATRLASLPADIAAAEQLAISPAGDAIAAPRAAKPRVAWIEGDTLRWAPSLAFGWWGLRPVLRWTHAGIVFGAYGERADSAWRLTQSRLYRISRDAVRGAGHDDAPIAERLGSGFGGEAGWKAGSQDVLIGDARTGDVFAIGFAGTQSVLLHLPAGSTEFREAARLPGEVTALSAAPDGRTLAIGLSRRDRFPEVYVARVGSGPSGARVSEFRPVTDLNATLNALPAPTVETIRWPNGEGDLVNGVLYWPPGRQGARGLPLVVVAHGGPFSLVLERLTNPTAWAYYPALLASRGYLVLYPNYRGSTGQGDEFVRKLIGYGCSRPVADVVSGVDHLVAQGWADSARVGIAGASAGGTVVNCAIGRSGRFRAAASAEGFWNNFSAYATSRSASPTTLVDGGLRRGEPWGAFDRDRWWQESALASAASIRTPTIVVHGARDVNVDAGQSREMAFALRRLGVPHRLMLFEDEAHHFTRPSNKLTKVAAEIDWLDRYLLRDGQP